MAIPLWHATELGALSTPFQYLHETLVESDHVILELNMMLAQVTEQSQTIVLNFKKAVFNKLRKKL